MLRLGPNRPLDGFLHRFAPQLLVVALAMMGATGCQPKIGDECTTAIDCSSLGDRLCDTSQPDGYCTIFNCEPDNCPEEASCVAFGTELDPACQEADDGRNGRFARSFCMRICDSSEDCRAGYECVRPADRSAFVVDVGTSEDNPQNTKICLAINDTPQTPPGTNAPIPNACYPNSPQDLPPGYVGTGGQGGTAGMGGMSAGGAGGIGGAGGMSAGGAGGN